MYLRHGELNEIAPPTHGDLEFSTIDLDTFDHPDDHGAIVCPADGNTMSKVDFNVDSAIILDYCTKCLGFWLDAGELARINEEVQRLNVAEEEIPDPLLVRLSRFFWGVPIR